jgi:hypothetical protein
MDRRSVLKRHRGLKCQLERKLASLSRPPLLDGLCTIVNRLRIFLKTLTVDECGASCNRWKCARKHLCETVKEFENTIKQVEETIRLCSSSGATRLPFDAHATSLIFVRESRVYITQLTFLHFLAAMRTCPVSEFH